VGGRKDCTLDQQRKGGEKTTPGKKGGKTPFSKKKEGTERKKNPGIMGSYPSWEKKKSPFLKGEDGPTQKEKTKDPFQERKRKGGETAGREKSYSNNQKKEEYTFLLSKREKINKEPRRGKRKGTMSLP